MGKAVSENVIKWLEDELSTQSSIDLDLADSDTKGLTTVIIFVVSAILAIMLLFVIAIFIDCRHQKIQKLQSKPKKKLKLKLPVPIVGRPVREDQNSILDKIEYGEPSMSNGNVI